MNIISVVVVIVTSALAFLYYHDDMDIKIPYLNELFLGSAVILGGAFLTKLLSRWPALFTAMSTKGYQLSPKGFRKVMIYEGIMLLYFGVFSLVMLKYIDLGFWTGIVGLLLFLEGLFLLVTQLVKSPFKVLMNEKAITLITNNWEVVSWEDIQRIDSRQNDIHLIRQNGNPVLVDLEWINKEERTGFIEKITDLAHEKGVYCSIDCAGEYQDFSKLSSQPIYNK